MTVEKTDTKEVNGEQQTIEVRELLESKPVGWNGRVELWSVPPISQMPMTVHAPILSLYCDKCNGAQNFSGTADERIRTFHVVSYFYSCRNCEDFHYYFSLISRNRNAAGTSSILKVGQYPQLPKKSPTRLLRLLGREGQELYLQGRRAEMGGFGIGAFAYYRRVVESARDKLFDEIIAVTETVESQPTELVEKLKQAKGQYSFTSSIDELKNLNLELPHYLDIHGENPLRLLHKALSDSLHNRSDCHALELAQDARKVLVELLEKIAAVRRDNAALKESVKRLADAPQVGKKS